MKVNYILLLNSEKYYEKEEGPAGLGNGKEWGG